MLADLDDPPRSRTRDLLFGALAGLPVVGVIAWFLLPSLAGMIQGNASSLRITRHYQRLDLRRYGF